MKLAQLSMISLQLSENTYFLGPSSLYEPDPDLEKTGDDGGVVSFILTGVTSSGALESENTFLMRPLSLIFLTGMLS